MKQILIVNANYYDKISKNLVSSSKKLLIRKKTRVKIFNVAGIFEIPVAIKKNVNNFHGFIALGCVIKGQTPHFDFISKSTTDAIMNISVESKKPVGNGIITCLNKNQAIARGKKGREAANAVKTILSL